MWKWFMAVATIAASVVSPAGTSSPPTVTLTELRARPWLYAHKIVRVRGEVDECEGFTCDLCPETPEVKSVANADTCLGLDFGLSSGGDFAYDAESRMDEAFRFATVTLDAKFEPGCLTGTEDGRPPAGETDAVVVCLDRVTSLHEARVLRVHARKTLRDGVVTGIGHVPVRPASDSEAGPMIAAWRDAQPWLPDKDAAIGHAFVMEDPDISRPPVDISRPPVEAIGMVCICVANDACESQWPTRWGPGFRSVANPYDCNYVAKVGGRWRATY